MSFWLRGVGWGGGVEGAQASFATVMRYEFHPHIYFLHSKLFLRLPRMLRVLCMRVWMRRECWRFPRARMCVRVRTCMRVCTHVCTIVCAFSSILLGECTIYYTPLWASYMRVRTRLLLREHAWCACACVHRCVRARTCTGANAAICKTFECADRWLTKFTS